MKEYLTTEGDGLTIDYTAPALIDSVVYTITDLDLGEILFADEATFNEESETYALELSSDICKYDRKLRIDIELLDYGTPSGVSSVGSNGSYATDFLDISLVRPYVTADELAEELGLTIVTGTPADTSEIKRSTLERYERQARMFINSKIDDKIRLRYKTVTVVGEDTDVLYLGERIESFDKITKDDEVVYDYQEDINLLDYTLEISKSKLQLKPFLPQYNIDEGKAMSAVYDPGYFERGSIYSVRGEYGWKNVPEELREATIILVDDMRCNDFSYRNKGLKSVKNDSFDIQYNDVIFSGTGNILVDSLISEFKQWRFFAI